MQKNETASSVLWCVYVVCYGVCVVLCCMWATLWVMCVVL